MRQQPLTATDHGDSWRVEGVRNRDHSPEGDRLFFTIDKFDGRITDFGKWGRVSEPHPTRRTRISTKAGFRVTPPTVE
jgi:hypothetical protein